ncbi:MAG: hypothetical protein ACI9OJ_001128 [Myxococcota bacterium]
MITRTACQSSCRVIYPGFAPLLKCRSRVEPTQKARDGLEHRECQRGQRPRQRVDSKPVGLAETRKLAGANMISRQAILGLATALCFGLALPAASAQSLTVQGSVRNLGGPVVDGSYGMTLSFYASETAVEPTFASPNVAIMVAGGVFSYDFPLDANALQSVRSGLITWFGASIEGEAELPRAPLVAVPYSRRADRAADVDCTGCISASELGASVLAPYALTASLAPVATSGAYSDLSGQPNLATVATTGNYADLQGKPSLSEVAESGAYASLFGKPDLAAVATTGSYISLSDKPSIPTTFSCSVTPWGAWAPATGCEENPEPLPPACPAGTVFMGVYTFTQSDAGCGQSSITRARVKSNCCDLQ